MVLNLQRSLATGTRDGKVEQLVYDIDMSTIFNAFSEIENQNRSLGALRGAQLASAINYSNVNVSSVLHRPRDEGLVAIRPISSGSREVEYKLTDFGTYVAKDLDDNIPVRLTGVILEQYRNSYLRRSA